MKKIKVSKICLIIFLFSLIGSLIIPIIAAQFIETTEGMPELFEIAIPFMILCLISFWTGVMAFIIEKILSKK